MILKEMTAYIEDNSTSFKNFKDMVWSSLKMTIILDNGKIT